MDRYRTLALSSLVCLVLLTGAVQQYHRAILALNRGAAASPYVLTENFEGTGYDETTANSWVETNNPNEDYTATVLAGSQSWFAAATNDRAAINIPAADEYWAYFMLRIPVLGSLSTFFQFETGGTPTGGSHVCAARINLDGTMRVTSGTPFVTTSTVYVINTTYHVWLRCKRDLGGGTGIAELYVATTATKPASPEVSITTGTITGTINTVLLVTSNGATDVILDKVRISTSSIGSNPT